MRKLFLASAIVLLSTVVASAISTIKRVTLDDGRDDVNKIAAPLFAGADVQPLGFTMTQTFDRSAKIVRKGATNMFTKGPEYNLDKTIDLAVLLRDALNAESASMGFRAAAGAEAAWMIEGTIKEIYLESKQIPYGATLFYGYLDLGLRIRHGSDPPQERSMRFHNFAGGYNAGMGRRDEAAEALGHLIVESAQEAVSRLNREFFKAPARFELTESKMAGLETRLNELHSAGLAGSVNTARLLLGILPRVVDDRQRAAVVDALARIGSPEAIPLLTERFATEDEDPRWYTLKAMDYIGGAEALALVKGAGIKDKDGGPRRLAQRIAAAK